MFRLQLLLTLCFVCALTTNKVAAQIIPDDTLGNENSIVNPTDELNDRIEGGATRGSNLFHSFREFNVGAGREVDFANPTGIENILTRVTGNNVSNILGRLGVSGGANLFLINPNGIIFGEGARLDISGSFYGSTADSIVFPDRVEFSAVNPQTPILTINRPIGLAIGNNPGTINSSVSQNSTGEIVGLGVDPRANLILVGGDINFESLQVTAPGGRVELGGLSEIGIVTITEDGSLSFPQNVERSNITLTNGANVQAGDIVVNANNLELLSGSSLNATFSGREFFFDLGDFETGRLNISADSTISIQGEIEAEESIEVTTDTLDIRDEGRIFTNENISLDTNGIAVEGQEARPENDLGETITEIFSLNLHRITIPTKPLDLKIADLCTPGTKAAKSQFIITGRGGIAPNNLEALQINYIEPDWVEFPRSTSIFSTTTSSNINKARSSEIIEAQGWIKAENGEVILVADAAAVTPHDSWYKSRKCARH